MKRSNRLVLLIGVFLAVVAFVGIAILLGQGDGPPGPGQATPAVNLNTVIATRDIPLGVKVTAEMVTTQELPIGARKAGAFEDPGQVIGLTVRQSISNGAHVTASDFSDEEGIRPGDLEVPPGMLAIAVQVDQVSGVGTVIRRGDYVDMVVGITGDAFPVVTLDPDDETITVVQGLNSTSVKLLIEGMQVIGTLLPPPPAQTNQNQQPQPSGQPATTLGEGQQEIVILAVTAQQAEIIKFAQLDGDISLALRSPSDFVDEDGNPIVVIPAGTTGIVLRTIVDGYGVLVPELVEALIPAQ